MYTHIHHHRLYVHWFIMHPVQTDWLIAQICIVCVEHDLQAIIGFPSIGPQKCTHTVAIDYQNLSCGCCQISWHTRVACKVEKTLNKGVALIHVKFFVCVSIDP